MSTRALLQDDRGFLVPSPLVGDDVNATSVANAASIRTKAQTALTDNATFLAIANPTAAQNAAQAKALTRQTNGIIRLLLGRLDDVSDT